MAINLKFSLVLGTLIAWLWKMQTTPVVASLSEDESCKDELPVAIPEDCFSYYQCTRDEGHWSLVSKECDEGSHFDENSRSCKEGPCSDNVDNPSTPPPASVPPPPSPSPPPKSNATEGMDPHMVCTPPGSRRPHPTDPSKFIKCEHANGTARKYTFNCPPFAKCFNITEGKCSPNSCPKNFTLPSAKPACSPPGVRTPNLKDLTTYYYCDHSTGTARRSLLACKPPGTCWDGRPGGCSKEACSMNAVQEKQVCSPPGARTPYLKDPTKYFYCEHKNGTARRYIFPCQPPGTCWDGRPGGCSEEACLKKDPIAKPSLTIPPPTCEVEGSFRSSHCRVYYTCVKVGGKLRAVLFDCPPGYHVNPERFNCVEGPC